MSPGTVASRVAMSRVLNADQSLYDALHHSAAVVGLNTSAQIEAGILGKPVLTLLAPGFEQGQQGTLHFRYLLREQGGFVEIASDLDEHRNHLARAVAGAYDVDEIRRAVERFIRPAGLASAGDADSGRRDRATWRPRSPRPCVAGWIRRRAQGGARHPVPSADPTHGPTTCAHAHPVSRHAHHDAAALRERAARLADRGHAIRVASHRVPRAATAGVGLASAHCLRHGPGRRGDVWTTPIHEFRALRDYMRYLDDASSRPPSCAPALCARW